MEKVIINNQEYEVDSSGAKLEKDYYGILWKLNGELHRLDGPAVIWNNGTKFWYQNDQPHNIKGPAKIYSDGTQCWYIKGKFIGESKSKFIGESKKSFTQEKFEKYLLENHKIVIIDDKEYIVKVDSSGAKPEKLDNYSIGWKLNGRYHRVDGPAVIYCDGDKHWYQDGQRHNLKGPAIIRNNEDQEWWIEDELIGKSKKGFTQEKFELYLKNDIDTENNSNTKTILSLLGICNAANLLDDNFKSKLRVKNSPILEEVVLDKNQH